MQTTVAPRTSTHTRVQNHQFLTGLRIMWLIFIAFCIGLFIYNLPFYFVNLRDSAQFGGSYAEILRELGLSQSFFASYFTGTDIILVTFSSLIAAFIFRLRSDDWLALLVSASIVISAISTSPGISTQTPRVAAIFIGINTFLILINVMIFPDGRFVPSWMRYVVPPAIAVIPAAAYNRALIQSGADFDFLFMASSTVLGVIFLLVTGAQVYRYRKIASQTQRQQIKWLILAVCAFMTMLILYMTIPVFVPNIAYPGLYPEAWIVYTRSSLIWMFISIPIILFIVALFPISILVGILRYRLWDVDIVINRSLVYGIVVLLAIALFFAVVSSLQVTLGNTEPLIALLISGVLSAAFFRPVRNTVQRLVDHYIYGLRFDLNELNQAQQALTITNPGKLTGLTFGDYEVRGVVGKGGMGEVYEGSGKGQRVAIKTMLPEIAKNPELRTRFQREVEAGQSLQHANIAQVLASGEYDGTPYLIMEYVEGQDLSDILDKQGRFDEETAIRILQDVCSALEVAHSAGYIHRDIKPSNIMIRNNGSAVLMDFGISKVKDAHTITGTGVVGTIQYMAPEQIKAAKDIDHRADIYALAAVLYHMLIGETPFTGGAAQILFAQVQQPAPDPRTKQAGIPDALAEAILKALEKEPDARFDSVKDFAAALQI